ncbi:hypothetical protein AGMMS49921_13710 [Endomicrobiia bacterium]|nr:hypothetical protein AGMMS49921_13710 [Endomicrobiia bacterium]
MTATPEKAEKQKADAEAKQESKDSKEEECSVCRSNMNKDEDLTTCAKCKNHFIPSVCNLVSKFIYH